jgi:hypothetical protein
LKVTTLADRHIVWLSAAFVLLMIVAFTPTYFAPVATGTFNRPAILHLHGALFFAWPVLFLVQAFLASSGRLQAHRSLGLLGIALATGMVFAGILAVATDLKIHQEGLALVALVGLAMFATFVTLALIYRKRRDNHMRWMFLATLAIMQAVSARFVARVILNAKMPADVPQVLLAQRAGVIHALFDVLVLSLVCVVDWKKRGRPHPVFVLGGGILVLVHLFRHLLLETSAWRATADMILRLTT